MMSWGRDFGCGKIWPFTIAGANGRERAIWSYCTPGFDRHTLGVVVR